MSDYIHNKVKERDKYMGQMGSSETRNAPIEVWLVFVC